MSDITSNIELVNLISWLSGLLVAVTTIYLTVRHFKTSKTISYIERLNSVDMVEIRADIDEWLSSEKSMKEKIMVAENDKELSAKLTIWMNIFTELGISYKNKIIRRKLTREIFYPMIPNYWKKLEFYIVHKRNKGNQIGYNFEYIAKEVQKIEKRKIKRPQELPKLIHASKNMQLRK